jgi:hypothetical protein
VPYHADLRYLDNLRSKRKNEIERRVNAVIASKSEIDDAEVEA